MANTTYISIHALREEGDAGGETRRYASFAISIHALREEGDRRRSGVSEVSTQYFYPRPPRGGRPGGLLP